MSDDFSARGKVGMVNATVNLSGMLSGRDVDGEVDVYVPEIELNGGIYGGVSAFLKNRTRTLISRHLYLMI